MSVVKPYPHYEINVIDNSIYTAQYDEVLPIHRPVYVMKTQEGPIGIPVWCESYTKAANIFGAQTFNEGNKTYFSPQAFFLKNTFTYNGAFIVRAADASATVANAILEAVVEKYAVPQYQRNEDGSFVLDENGNLIPETDSQGAAVTTAGIKISYQVSYGRRSVPGTNPVTYYDWDADSPAHLPIQSVGETKKIVPLMVVEALYEGDYGNDLTFQLYYRPSANDASSIRVANSVFTSFAPGRREYDSSDVTAIRDIYGSTFNTFCINPDVVDPTTGISNSMAPIFDRAYSESNTLPYTIYPYAENFAYIGNLIIASEVAAEAASDPTAEGYINYGTILGFEADDEFPTFDEIWNQSTKSDLGYKVNIYSLINANMVKYRTAVLDNQTVGDDAESVSLAESYNIYLKGGSDGSLNDVMVENAVRNFCHGDLFPEIEDEFKYPITHMYDVGFTMKTKYAMLDFLALREDVMVELSTQVLFEDAEATPIRLNAQLQDEANGEVLRSQALLMRESIAKGTECCRCAIYTQAGYPIAPTYRKPVPCTYWSAMKHAEYQNLPYMSGREPRGWPYSYNELFDGDLNWVPYSKSSRSRLWDNGFNYCISADMTRIFYPSLRTVYRYDTSALVDQWFVDAIVYLKHTIRQSWGKHVGRNDYNDVLQSAIEADLNDRITSLFGGKYKTTVRVYQTAEEAKIGYIQHVAVSITAPNTNRVWDVDIIVGREGLTEE